MARRKAGATVTHAGKDVVVVTPQSAPVQRRRRSSGGVTRRRKGSGRRRRSTAGGEGNYQNKMVAVGMGGVVYGFLEKQWPNMPTIPIVGKSGTIAAVCYFMGPKHRIIRDVGIAAAAIAGYSFGKTGTVSGDGGFDDD
jgi:hypothetical protein